MGCIGWSDKALALINEFTSHNICSALVILSEMDKEYQETTLHEYLDEMEVPRSKSIPVIFRVGNPASITSLQKVSASTASAILVLSDDSNNADISDAITSRVILSLKGLKEGLSGHIVAEMRYNEGLAIPITSKRSLSVKVYLTFDLFGAAHSEMWTTRNWSLFQGVKT